MFLSLAVRLVEELRERHGTQSGGGAPAGALTVPRTRRARSMAIGRAPRGRALAVGPTVEEVTKSRGDVPEEGDGLLTVGTLDQCGWKCQGATLGPRVSARDP